jgi:hypothetical protein
MKPSKTTIVGVLTFFGLVPLFAGGERGSEKREADSKPLKLTGVFDPFEVRDTNVTYAVVMEARPKCGECHAWAVLNASSQAPRLELFVAHGRTTNSWTIVGERKDKEIVFAKGKLHLTYADGCLKGAYEGRMRARIELKPEKKPQSSRVTP